MEPLYTVDGKGYHFSIERLLKIDVAGVIKTQLDMLFDSDVVSKTVSEYLLSHDKAVELSLDEQDNLSLPHICPYQFKIINNKGNIDDKDFHYKMDILQPNGIPFYDIVVEGSYLYLNHERAYIFSYNQYKLYCLILEANRVAKLKKIGKNFELLAEIQYYSKLVYADFEQYLKNMKIIAPTKLSVEFVEQRGFNKYYPEPILLQKYEDGYKAIDSNAFRKAFDSDNDVRDIYLGTDGYKYVCNDEIKKGLQSIKTVNSFNEEEYKEAQNNLWSYFPDDIFVFSEELYSDRVVGLGEGCYKYFGVEGLNEGGWIPNEGERNFDDREITEENVEIINEKVEQAEREGKNYIEFDGTIVEIDDKLKQKIENVLKSKNNFANQDNVILEDSKKNKTSNVLEIKPNAEKLDYVLKNKVRVNNGIFENALNSKVKLFDHQKDGVNWIFRQWCEGYKGVLLADDMGLGKTLQTLAFISGVKKYYPKHINNPILIVAPVALLKNWQEEFFKFVPNDIFREVVEMHSDKLKNFKMNGKFNLDNFAINHADDIVLTTYETLRIYQLEFGKIDWSIIIVDEVQKIKNPSARQTQALKAMKYDFTVCLSGTPVENSWIDLWSIMDFAQPGKLGNFDWFNEEYQKKLKYNKDNKLFIENLGNSLQQRLSPLFKRRLKIDHLKGLPNKYINICKAPMPKIQSDAYKTVIKSCYKERKSPFEIIAKLRDISLHPRLDVLQIKALDSIDPNTLIYESARLKKTFEILINIKIRNEKVLIFVISKKMQILLRYLVQKNFGIEVQSPINGDMNGVKRQAVIDEFNAKDGFGVLILSPEAAGVGLNIVSANNVIHLSRTWNPAKEDQATDRVYRIGQKKDVNVYIPIAYIPELGEGNCFDEKLNSLLMFKRVLSENVLIPTQETKDDFNNLFVDLTGVDINDDKIFNWCIEDIDSITGLAFEEVIQKLYSVMGYISLKTPSSNDRGADVIAWENEKKEKGYLIQCKQTTTNNKMNSDGVQEVFTALSYYEHKYKSKFIPVVITNAEDFTDNAKSLATLNNVVLITRNELAKKLEKYSVKKI